MKLTIIYLKAIILRHLGRREEALALIRESLALDRFNFGCGFEAYLLTGEQAALDEWIGRMRLDGHNYCELASDYASAGCWEEALAVADIALENAVRERTLMYYYRAWFLLSLGRDDEARDAMREAEGQSAVCVPNALEAIVAFQAVIAFYGNAPSTSFITIFISIPLLH